MPKKWYLLFGAKPEHSADMLFSNTISNGTWLESAKLTGSESIRIDGAFTGSADLNATLFIGETGRFIGNIQAKEVIVSGKVSGTIHCRAAVHLTPTARVSGVIEACVLKTDEGAHFDGQVKMIDEQGNVISTQPEEPYTVIVAARNKNDDNAIELGMAIPSVRRGRPRKDGDKTDGLVGAIRKISEDAS
jgi:cytoskeletal protein CcmA (bactofilin family)